MFFYIQSPRRSLLLPAPPFCSQKIGTNARAAIINRATQLLDADFSRYCFSSFHNGCLSPALTIK